MSHLCLCAKGLVSSASQLMPSHQRLQYSCGQHIQHICPPLPDSCSPDSMPALEITRDPCTWDNLCVLVLFFQSQPSTHSTPPNLISATSSPSSSPLYPLPFSPVFSAPLGFAASFLCLPSHEYPALQSCFFMVLQANSPWLCFIMHTPQGSKGITEIIFPSLYLFLDITNRTAFSSLQILYQNGNV